MSSNIDFAGQAPGAEGYRADHPQAAHCTILDRQAGEVDLKGRKKIAIVGFASSTRKYAPIGDPDWIICGLNQLYRHLPRIDVHFDIHSYWEQDNVAGTDHPKWINECGIPVYMADLYPEAGPTSVRYPIERLIQKFGIDYFTSTVAIELVWAIDYIDRQIDAQLAAGFAQPSPAELRALYNDYTIGIYGIDLIVGTEYEWQKACVEFWIGVATARGINFAIPRESALLKQQYRYGYEREPNTGILKMSELSTRAKEIEDIKAKLFVQMHQLNGRIASLTDVKTSMNGTAPAFVDEKIAEWQGALEKTVAELQTYDGAMQECVHIRTVMDLRLKGGSVPLAQFF